MNTKVQGNKRKFHMLERWTERDGDDLAEEGI